MSSTSYPPARNNRTRNRKKPRRDEIPDIVIGRLPIYLRTLRQMTAEGKEITSSQELGQILGISSAQIRKDLSHFGEFGKQGTGYNVTYLCRQLEKILNVDHTWPVVVVGAGSLGTAIANYQGFAKRGFQIVAICDEDPGKIGKEVAPGLVVEDCARLSARIREEGVKIAVIAVPAHAAQRVADMLVEAGIRAILCYAPTTLKVPPSVRVEYIDPVIHFQHMTYYLR